MSPRVSKYRLGQRIRVLRGTLEGAFGVICAVKAGNRYVLSIDGLPTGVYIAVDRDALAPEHISPTR